VKKAALALIALSLAVVAWFLLKPEPELEPAPIKAQPLTIRQTESGEVIGFVADGARTWLGVPYAQAPVGKLRWQPPRPALPWDGLRESIAAGPRCPQKPSALASVEGDVPAVIGDEDCLYLNIYAPANASRLPVMFWIHGGGNTIGSGAEYVGANLATRHNLVVVTINYRLGPLGWFAHPALNNGDPVNDSGNFGTLDIIRALEWTRDNITAFGGDPGNVTVFGESAGAFNTLAMVVSPLARGLFHRAISQSGGLAPADLSSARNYAADGGHPYSAREIVNQLMIADGSARDVADATARQNRMSATELRGYLYSKTTEDLFALWSGGGFGMINVPDNVADGYVLPNRSVAELFSDPASYANVPMILGTNRDEPALFMAQDPQHVTRFLGFLPRLRDEETYLRTVRYGALAWKARGVDELAEALTRSGNKAVYAYRFDFDELPSRGGYDLSKAIGAAHFLEVPFVFGDFVNFPLANLFGDDNPEQHLLSEQMMSYWAEFAYAGAPGSGRDAELPTWVRWGENAQRTLVLDTPAGGGLRMINDLVTRAALVAELATDPAIQSQEERCAIYRASFRWGGQFDPNEYASLGTEGCATASAEPGGS
jgi:para-nitrobenzyl esterase